MKCKLLIVNAIFVLVAHPAICQTTTTFTYQGELKQNGNPANGAYNMEFGLWNSPNGGTQLDTMVVNGVPVVDGRFSANLDFGASTFNLWNQNRWLQIKVNGSTLSPRSLISRSPYSLQTRGIRVNDDASFVGVGRDVGVTNSEVFGLYKNTTGFAGMYIETENGGVPFYGYSTAGDVDAYHYFHDSTGTWRLFAGGDRIIVEADSGDTEITDRLNIGGISQTFGQLTVRDSSPAAVIGIDVENTAEGFPAILAENAAGGPVIWAYGSDDVTPAGGGLIVAGAESGANIAIDGNEIMARSNGQVASLALNAEGGEVRMGLYDIHPAFAYGKILTDGTIISSSQNVTSVTLDGFNKYYVSFTGGLNASDIIVATPRQARYNLSAERAANGQLVISCYDASADNYSSRADIQFVVYRP